MGLFGKRHNVVIMDASNKSVMNEIIGIVGMTVCPNGGFFKLKKVDMDHPSMMMVEYKCSGKTHDMIRNIVDYEYPALCCFDVVM